MALDSESWWRRHAWTLTLLATAFSFSFLIRALFAIGTAQQFGWFYVYGGGSDSFYHSRVMEYIITNHTNLGLDHELKFPIGAINPREPLFDWMNAILGLLFAPFFGGNAVSAGAFFLELQGPLWASLGVVPVYLIGREVSSPRMGLIAALTYPFLVANIDSSTFGYANYLPFYTFFVLLTIYGYLRTVQVTGSRRWVASYRRPREILAGLRAFLQTERTAVKWAVFTGVSLGALALAWQGYTLAITAMVIFLIAGLVIERIRRVDSFGFYVVTWIIGLVGFPIAFPYFLVQGLFAGWFDIPLLLFFGALLIALPFVLLRDQPWVVSLPVLVGIAGAAVGILSVVNPTYYQSILTGQGYFTKTLVYSTVAEAQAPSIDALILGYGVVTFFVAFVGLALFLYKLARQRFQRQHLLFVVFAIMSIYLPVSAAKFFYIGSAAFALLPAEAIVIALDVAGYPTLRRNVASLADRRSQFAAFRRAFKARHVLVMLLVIGVLLPNIWYAMDAGIPYNVKSQYNTQIYDTLPAALRTTPSNASSYYLGAAGVQLDTPTQYDENGYDWLATQDQNLPPDQRPAFISWWDYGFQAVAEGKHPTVADNFQNGIEPAGNFLLSQNESQAIGILATALLIAEEKKSGLPYLPAALNSILARDGVNLAVLHTLLVNGSADEALVLAHPERYLPIDPSHLSTTNALYDTVAYFLASASSVNAVAQVYDDIQAYTGWSIRYGMVDSRLFPFSGRNTGIFYAPADLTDRVIGGGGAPTAYYTINALGSDGNSYPIGSVPPGVSVVDYTLARKPAFYNTMIYHIFIGYNGTQAGQSAGVPGLDISSLPIEPGWMLRHFQVVYRTAYYCPFSNPNQHPGCSAAVNLPLGESLQKKQNGTLNTSAFAYFSGGETILEYYPGEPMLGTVTLASGAPVAGARVTVYDSWHIPHDMAITGADGSYSVVLPPGDDTVNVTSGTFSALFQAGTTQLASLPVRVSPAIGFQTDAPALVQSVVVKSSTVQGLLYWNLANNTTYNPLTDPGIPGASVVLWGNGASRAEATTDASGTYSIASIVPGRYNVSILVRGSNFTGAALNPSGTIFTTAGGTVNESYGLAPGRITGSVVDHGGRPVSGATVTATAASGAVATATSGVGGAYQLTSLGTGNYTLTARVTSLGLLSPPVALTIGSPGQLVKQNLTVVPSVSLTLSVLASGSPVPNFTVRFSPIVGFAPLANTTGNGTPPPPTPSGGSNPATANSSVFVTNTAGQFVAELPSGNYSVYGLGLLGTQLWAGFESAYVSGAAHPVSLAPLVLEPASALRGTVSGAASSGVPPVIQVTAFDARGDQVSAFTNSTNRWTLWLPPGNYSLLTLQRTTAGTSAPPLVNLTSIRFSGAQSITTPLGIGEVVRMKVGQPEVSSPNGVFPSIGAQVSVHLAPSPATVSALTDSNGNVSFIVPASVALGASYCVNTTAFGFVPSERCGLSPSSLAAYSLVATALVPVPTNVTLIGYPTGATLHLNFTALGAPAVSRNASGGPKFFLSLAPGPYQVSAWAPVLSGPGVFLLAHPINDTFPVGARSVNLTIRLLHQVNATGVLRLPTGVPDSQVTVRLNSTTFNTSLSGAVYASHFLAAPGSYKVFASAPAVNGSGPLAAFANVSINATGVISTAVSLRSPGVEVTGDVTLPNGNLLNASVPVVFGAPGNFAVTGLSVGGHLAVLVPANLTYVPTLNVTLPISQSNGGSLLEVVTAGAGQTCPVSPTATHCNVRLSETPVRAEVNVTVTAPGGVGPVDGSAVLVGPYPFSTSASVAIVSGRFSASLLPGSYSVYARAGSAGTEWANITPITVAYGNPVPLTLGLRTTWTDTLTLSSPSAGSAPNALVTWSGYFGVSIRLENQSVGVPLAFPLPVGVWSVEANGSASPYGVATTTTATATVRLLSGNAATNLLLAPKLTPAVAISIVPPTAVSLPNGGTATFSFTVRNTGNVPVSFRFVGAPSTWNFTFLPHNLTLGTASGNSTAGGEVSIRVPSGTAVNHPAVVLEAVDTASGAVIGTATPPPAVDLVPVFGLRTGPSFAQGSIAPTQGTVSFWVFNSGTAPEAVSLSVADATRLASLGWTATVEAGGRVPVAGTEYLSAGQNSTFSVVLAAPTGHALPPGSVTVLATVANASARVSVSTTIPVPVVAVAVNPNFVITGPSTGSPPAYPDWLIPVISFVPALAFAAFAVTYRWYRTRRWIRR